MYAILVEEPGSEAAKAFILADAASSSQSAMTLMQSRAEEYVDEHWEAGVTEDYNIADDAEALVVTVDLGGMAVITFTASAIDQVI